jgi:hypothetical protein
LIERTNRALLPFSHLGNGLCAEDEVQALRVRGNERTAETDDSWDCVTPKSFSIS